MTTDLIVANSFDSVDAITKLGKANPDQKWAVVDTTVDNAERPRARVPGARGLLPDRRDLRAPRNRQLRTVPEVRT